MFSFFRKRDETTAAAPQAAATAPADTPAAAAPPEASAQREPEATTSPEAPAAPAPEAAPVQTDQGFNIDALVAPPPVESAPKAEVGAPDQARTDELTPSIIEALRTIYDPEIPVNIYDLGLIYDIAVDTSARAKIAMTLTSPACPSAQQLPVEVEWKVKEVAGVDEAVVQVVWDPPWSKERMSEEARLALGMF
ncbi:MAG: DUF59 domain-containing protein [Luteitalea sp.]|nr:DUF59 domain-containing protein [Luteitalea sp.]